MGSDENAMEPVTPVKLTYEDLCNIASDGRRHELIDGEHYVTPSPNTRHQQLSIRLASALAAHLERSGAGEVFSAPYDVVLTEFDVVEPDLLVVLTDQREIVTEAHVRGVPALVVEILSPGTRRTDERTKRRLYDRVGVREYWVVDPELDLVKVHRRADDGSFPRVAELTREAGEAVATPLLPGFLLDLGWLFRP